MHAIIRIGSHQYDVSPGATITVEKLDGPVGSEVRFRDLLLVSGEDKVTVGSSLTGTVFGTITEQAKGPKILVFKKRRRKDSKRLLGHRQLYTKVAITKIEV